MQRRAEDAGVALISAVLMVALSASVVVVMVGFTLGESRQTGGERQRQVAVAGAEGAVDATVARIAGARNASLPCGTTTAVDGSVLPDTVTTTTGITYYDAGGVVLGRCPLAATDRPSTALVRSVATTQRLDGTLPRRRVMEAVLRLTQPRDGTLLADAIFGNGAIVFNNNVDINASTPGASDADVYTNGSFSCSSQENIQGSVIAQGNLVMSNSCTVAGDAVAGGDFTASSPSNRIDGKVRAPTGNATIDDRVRVGGGVQARGQISWGGCPSQCSQPATPDPVPVQEFPQLSGGTSALAEWAAGGWTVVTNDNCTSSGGPAEWITANAALLTTPTLVRTRCAVTLSSSFRLGSDLAVVADGGIAVAGGNIRPTTPQDRLLYLIQPYDAVAQPCNPDAITLGNQVTVDKSVAVLLYTPCNVRKSNRTSFTGQIYAGNTVRVDNRFIMTFQSLPVYGVIGSPALSWKVEILSKREGE